MCECRQNEHSIPFYAVQVIKHWLYEELRFKSNPLYVERGKRVDRDRVRGGKERVGKEHSQVQLIIRSAKF